MIQSAFLSYFPATNQVLSLVADLHILKYFSKCNLQTDEQQWKFR